MYQKTHRKLALFFAGITSLILIILSATYQYLSEKETRNSSFPAFSGEMNTFVSNLENRTTISHEWLAKISGEGKYIIALYDNGTPLSYNATTLTVSEQSLIQEVLDANQETITQISNSSYYGTTHKEFTYQSTQGENYYVCYSYSNRSHGTLSAVILFSIRNMEERLYRQRLQMLFLNLIGIIALFIFSFFYTGHLLRPIRKSQEEQAAFVAAASHELRTPISVICSSISALKCADATEQAPFLATIESEATRVSYLVGELLTLSRSDNHTWTFHMEDTELDTLLLNLYETYEPLAVKENIKLSLHLPDETFPMCHCDRERITQVMEILLSNAFSYTAQNGNIGAVSLKLYKQNHAFCIQVSDNGIGISPEAKKHIFERFYREDSSHSGKEHFGLGLSIAAEIVTAHHGKILVSDTPGGGTTFSVLLPQSV